jgi:hypothetical protein
MEGIDYNILKDLKRIPRVSLPQPLISTRLAAPAGGFDPLRSAAVSTASSTPIVEQRLRRHQMRLFRHAERIDDGRPHLRCFGPYALCVACARIAAIDHSKSSSRFVSNLPTSTAEKNLRFPVSSKRVLVSPTFPPGSRREQATFS